MRQAISENNLPFRISSRGGWLTDDALQSQPIRGQSGLFTRLAFFQGIKAIVYMSSCKLVMAISRNNCFKMRPTRLSTLFCTIPGDYRIPKQMFPTGVANASVVAPHHGIVRGTRTQNFCSWNAAWNAYKCSTLGRSLNLLTEVFLVRIGESLFTFVCFCSTRLSFSNQPAEKKVMNIESGLHILSE